MKNLIFIFTFILISFFSSHVFALNTQGLKYYSPTGRALSLVESKPLPKDTVTLGFGFNYANSPLEVGTAGGTRVSGVVDDLFTLDFLGSYSLFDNFSIGLNIPLHITSNLANIGGTAMETSFNIGDIMISGVYNIIDPAENSINAGFSLVPFFTLPSGKNSDYVGDANVTGGILLVGDIDLSGHYLGVNLGFKFRKTENFLNLSVGHEFMYTLAYHHSIYQAWQLSGFAEIGGTTVMKNFWQKTNSSPFEIRGGLTKSFMDMDQLKATLGTGIGFGNGFSSPDFRGLLKITYDFKVKRSIVTRIEKIERELNELTIYYPTDGSQVDPYYDEKIASIAKILRKNPDLGTIYIISHTDDVASHKYNQRLSERRAKQAYSSIVESGLDPRVIVSMGLGEDYPKVENTSDANRALNRRTLFTFIKPQQLQQKQTKRGLVGYNILTGKKNDSYTEVLKELDKEQKQAESGSSTVVVKKYKDTSSVIVDDSGSTKTKDRPDSKPKKVNVKPRSKKYYENKKRTGKTKKNDVDEQDLYEEF